MSDQAERITEQCGPGDEQEHKAHCHIESGCDGLPEHWHPSTGTRRCPGCTCRRIGCSQCRGGVDEYGTECSACGPTDVGQR